MMGTESMAMLTNSAVWPGRPENRGRTLAPWRARFPRSDKYWKDYAIDSSSAARSPMFPSWMSSDQAWQWQISLQLRLRQVHGDGFQEFFSDVMARSKGDDYIRVRAFGSLGDKGCDGYLLSTGSMFQCYGKLADAAVKVSTIVAKINEDFALALENFEGSMKEWCFVHNLFDGLPAEALQAILALRTANPKIKIGTMGPDRLETYVFDLPELDMVGLLGPAGTAEHTKNMRIEDVAAIVHSVMSGIDANMAPLADPKPVPFDKMDFNAIPPCWRGMLSVASKNAAYIDDYLQQTTDPELGQRMARVFRHRYEALKVQSLSPGAIMAKLYEGITGIGSVPLERQIAAQAVLAFLFESCDIFEDDASKVPS